MNWVNRIFRQNESPKVTSVSPFFDFERAAHDLIEWSKAVSPSIYRVEFVTPNVDLPGTRVWVYCETLAGLNSWSNTTRAVVEGQYLLLLKNKGVSDRWVDNVTFVFDSHENVVRNYGGDYTARLFAR